MSDVQLYQGDCLEFMRAMPAGSVDAVITDPPYGLGDKWTGGTWFQRGVYNGAVDWDTEPPQEIINEILKRACTLVIWGGNYFHLPPSRCWDIWSKTNSVNTMADFEMCWTNRDAPAKAFMHSCNGWQRSHPTEKPLPLMMWQVERHTKPGDTVFDPFMGSGTTGVACVKTGRNFIGCELDPGYFAIAERRIAEAQMQPLLLEVN